MKKTLLCVVLLTLFVSLGVFAWDKIPVDPNAGTTAVQQPVVKEADDPRLAKKVTLDSGSERLHRVVAKISEMTGVNISCGTGDKDWRVRDIPVVVCVKDMPLGKLFEAVADATHTRFEVVSEKEPVKRYRIYRRVPDQAEIDSAGEKESKTHLAEAEWQWDAMAAYGKTGELPGVPKSMWVVAKMVAALEPEGRERLFSGKTLRFYSDGPVTGKLFDELYMLRWNIERPLGDVYEYAPVRDDFDMAELDIELCKSNIEVAFGPILLGYDKPNGQEQPRYSLSFGRPDDIMTLFQQTRSLPDKGLKLPPYPEKYKVPTPKDDIKNPDLTWLRTYNDWQRPLLQAKIDLPRLDITADPTFADLVGAVAKASGLNIIAEDFRSQLSSREQLMGKAEYGPRFKEDTTTAEAIALGAIELVGYDWFFDENAKLLVGWAGDWRTRHKTLPSEEYLASLKKKVSGPGLEFDDVIHLMDVPQEWIGWSRNLYYIRQHILAWDEQYYWWRLYDKLKPEDKQLAKSSEGLSFAKLDPVWIADFITEQRKQRGLTMRTPMSREAGDRDAWRKFEREYYDLMDWAKVDPSIISTMVMRLQKQPVTSRWFDASPNSVQSAPEELSLYTYSMTIDYVVDKFHKTISVLEPRFGFPLRSPEREAEVLKELASKEGK